MGELDPQVFQISENKAQCLACKDGKIRRLDNARRHQGTSTHQEALLHLKARTKAPNNVHSPPLRIPLQPTTLNTTNGASDDPTPFLSDLATRQLLRSMIHRANGHASPQGASDSSSTPASPPSPPLSPSGFDWDLFDAHGGMQVDVSPDALGAAKIAEALLQYQEYEPSDSDSDDDSDDSEPDERSVTGNDEPEADLFEDLHDAQRQAEEAPQRTAAQVATDEAAARYWFPWPNRTACTLDILMHLPRSVFSQKQLDLFLWILRVNNVDHVPSVKTMQSLNESLQKLVGIDTIRYDGALGHKYYVNSLADIIAQEMANPQVRPHLHFYPEDAGDHLSEVRQSRRWLKELSDDQLTPMVRLGQQDFYIHEPTYLDNREYCIPIRFYTKKNVLMAKCWKMEQTRGPQGNGWCVKKVDNYDFPVSRFLKSFPQIRQDMALYRIPDPSKILYVIDSDDPSSAEPWTLTDPALGNPWRLKAKGARVLAFPMWMYCDDTSGNKSKKWNKHNSFLFTPAGLPRSEAQKEYNVHFLSTSNLAPPLEMLDGIVDQLEAGERDGIWAWDCILNERVLLFPVVMALLGDNPMQSEFACHIGLRGKLFCRVCKVTGKDALDTETGPGASSYDSEDEDRETAPTSAPQGRRRKFIESLDQMVKRVTAFIKPGTPRTPQDTKDTLTSYFTNLKTAGNDSKVKKMRTAAGIKDTYQNHFLDRLAAACKHKRGNDRRQEALDEAVASLPENIISPVWRIKGLDPHRDTPVEILHVVLLGFIKYFWRDLIQNQLKGKEDKKTLLATRLTSLDVSGLGLSPLPGDTLVNYAGSLVGRDFRIIAQVAPFVIYDLVNDECRDAWLALSKLVPLIWQPKIDGLDAYLTTLEKEIQHFLLSAAKWTNRWFNKPKFHVLVHLPDHIRRFGPAMLFATEAFESYNAVIREKSIHSNRHAPSRDIALAFAQGNRLRHLLSSGFFQLRRSKQDDEAHTSVQPRTVSGSHADWTAIGDGPRHIIHSSRTVCSYLGISHSQPDHRGCCTIGKTACAVPFFRTRTSQECPELHSVSSTAPWCNRFLQADAVKLCNDDVCRCGEFVVLETAAPERLVGRVIEILKPATSLSDVAHGILVQVFSVFQCPETSQVYGMPALRPTGRFMFLDVKSLLCTVNVQHNCAAQKCKASGTVVVYQEREKTTHTRPRVVHINYDTNLVLNTAQMRDGLHVQPFRIPAPSYSASDVSGIILQSAIKENPRRETSSTAASQLPSRNVSPALSRTGSPALSRMVPHSIPPRVSLPTFPQGPVSSTTTTFPTTSLQPPHILPTWQQLYDNSGRPYYYNHVSKTSSWNAPLTVPPVRYHPYAHELRPNARPIHPLSYVQGIVDDEPMHSLREF